MTKLKKQTLLALVKISLVCIVGFCIFCMFLLWPKKCQSMNHVYDFFSVEQETQWKNEEYLSLYCLTEKALKSVLRYQEDKYKTFAQAIANHKSKNTAGSGTFFTDICV